MLDALSLDTPIEIGKAVAVFVVFTFCFSFSYKFASRLIALLVCFAFFFVAYWLAKEIGQEHLISWQEIIGVTVALSIVLGVVISPFWLFWTLSQNSKNRLLIKAKF